MGGGDPDVVREHIASGEEPDVEGFRGRGLYLLAQMLDRLEVERSRDGRGLQFIASKRWGAPA
jgi:anti-sigma regulatory factor (Ser/Thr protein kinase)